MRILLLLLCAFQEPSGQALIEKLQNEATRKEALINLINRSGDKEDGKIERRDPLLRICPQEDGKPPLYVVLSRFLPDRDNPGGDASGLFAKRGPTERLKNRVIDVFSADGKLLKPFGGSNCVDDGLLLDMNGDGILERADTTSYGVDGVKTAQVLLIESVLEKPRPLFAVVYNFHLTEWAEDWGYDFTPHGKDGPWEIHLGPLKNKREIERKVSFQWDKAAGTWTSPAGVTGDHFRVVDARDLWKSLKKLKAEQVSFPRAKAARDPDLDDFDVPAPGVKGPDQPYVAGSLKNLSPEALLRYMGNSEPAQSWTRLSVPADFWTVDPKAAMLALVKANQADQGIRLAIDDRNVAAPKACTVSFTDQSSRCYNAVDTHWFLRCDPKLSFVAQGLEWEEGVALRGTMKNGKIYDLKFVEVDYRDALHLSQVLWWLSRLRSDSEGERHGGMMFSTADGKGDFWLQTPKGDPAAGVALNGRLWSDAIATRWKGAFSEEAYINFADAVISHVLPARLGPKWPNTTFGYFQKTLSEEKPGQIRNACKELLRRCAEEPGLVSLPVAKTAIAVAGEKGVAESLPDLAKLQKSDALQEAATAALQKLDSAKDQKALEKMAISGNPDEAWALEQLRARFPEAHAQMLERRLATAGGDAALNLFHQLLEAQPERAAAVAEALSPDRRDHVAVAAFALLQVRGKPIPDENKRVETLISMALDPGADWKIRAHAIDALVPAESPRRLTTESIDAALLKLLDPALGDKNLNFTQSHAMNALALRTGARHVEALLEAYKGAKDSFLQQGMLPTLARVAREPGPARDKVVDAIRAEFRETQLMMNELAWSVWMGGLTELKPDLERVATLGPDSPEGRQAHSAGGGRKAVSGRCHAARKVVAIWNEPDAPTKAKLLAALVIMDLGAIREPGDLRVLRWDAEVTATAAALNADGRRDVLAFVAAQRGQARGIAAKTMLDRLESALKKD